MNNPKAIDLGAKSQTPDPLQGLEPAPTTNLPARPSYTGAALAPISMEEANSFGQQIGSSIGSITAKITDTTRMGDIDEVGKGLDELLLKAREYDPNVMKQNPLMRFFTDRVAKLQNKFRTVDSAVDTLVVRVDSQINLFRTRLGDLDAIYVENERKHQELGKLIPQIQDRIAWMEANVPALDPNDALSAQTVGDWNNRIAYANKRVDDLKRLQVLCELQAPQIMMMKTNANGLVSKFGELKATTIPAMKMAFSLYIMNLEAERGSKMAKAIDDQFNDTLVKNSAALGRVTRGVQENLARSTVDFATLEQVQKDTIDTIQAVHKIRSDMKARIQAEAPKLAAMSNQVALLTARKV